MKDLGGSALWTPVALGSLGAASGYKATAVTIGIDTIYCAIDEEIMIYPLTSSSPVWSSAYTYPNGTKINFLFYDELLVGTSHGLYAQYGETATVLKEERASDKGVSIYPNPATDYITIHFESTPGVDGSLKVYDVMGRLAMSQQLNVDPSGNCSLNLANMEPGVYSIQVCSGDRLIYVSTLIKR